MKATKLMYKNHFNHTLMYNVLLS